jgi:hypothetical protein
MSGRSRRDLESEPGSIPVEAIVQTETARDVLTAGEPTVLFLPANAARQPAGISVGIGSNQRRKLLQIQMVIGLGGYRPGHHQAIHRRG